MPSALTYPGVYIEEISSGVHTITGVATSIAAFVGYTAQGIDNRAEHVFSFSDFERLFGGLAPDSEVSYAVQQFFQNGGTEAYVVRAKRPGASAASTSFVTSLAAGNITWQFSALSSGLWANGNLTLDVDYQGLSTPVTGKFGIAAANSPSVTGTGTSFMTDLAPGQWLVFASDATSTPYQIKSIGSPTALTLQKGVAAAPLNGDTAQVYYEPDVTAFNLTITNWLDGTVEKFPGVSLNPNSSSFILSAVNDPDTGSQLVNVLPASPVVSAPIEGPVATGTIGGPVALGLVCVKLCGGATPVSLANLTVTKASNLVAGTGLPTDVVGEWLVFDYGESCGTYQITAATATQITLASSYSGPTNSNIGATVISQLAATADFYSVINFSSPNPAPPPLPLTVKVFSKGSTPPMTLTGLAAKLQTALSKALTASVPGATLTCSVAQWSGSLRVVATLPNFPDAVVAFDQTGAGLSDLSPIVSLAHLPVPTQIQSSNVARYTLGTGHAYESQTASTAGINVTNGPSLPGTAELLGDESLFTGIYALEKVDLFNILCIPEATRANPGDPNSLDSNVNTNAIYSEALAYCIRRRAFLIIDAPPNINNVGAAVDWKTTLLTVEDPYGRAAAYFPRLRLPDPLNGYQLRTFAPSGVVAGLYARIDASRGVWKAPAGTEATLSGVQSLVYKLSDGENGALNPLGLNCARTFPVYGTVIWGARTIAGADAEASEWKYVPVRRFALFLEESLYRGTKWVVFEPNDKPLWAQIRLNLGAFMQTLFRQGAFQGSTPKDAYFVKCDSETTTQNDIDSGIVNVVVGFAPLKPAEFVVIKIQQIAGSIQT